MTIRRQQWHDHVRLLIFEEGGSIQVEHYPRPLGISQCQAYAFGLWVEPEHRKQGIAKRLMATAEQVTREAGINRLFIRTWPGEATRWTKRWYSRLGYAPRGFMSPDGATEWTKELK